MQSVQMINVTKVHTGYSGHHTAGFNSFVDVSNLQKSEVIMDITILFFNSFVDVSNTQYIEVIILLIFIVLLMLAIYSTQRL